MNSDPRRNQATKLWLFELDNPIHCYPMMLTQIKAKWKKKLANFQVCKASFGQEIVEAVRCPLRPTSFCKKWTFFAKIEKAVLCQNGLSKVGQTEKIKCPLFFKNDSRQKLHIGQKKVKSMMWHGLIEVRTTTEKTAFRVGFCPLCVRSTIERGLS